MAPRQLKFLVAALLSVAAICPPGSEAAESAGLDHWAFQAPRPVDPPKVDLKRWPRNAVDRFVLGRLEAEGLSPSPEADRYTLIRRLSLDLTGLPPTPEEVRTFVEDRSRRAYERLVERLLASPHYGERQARFWLDAARYADTNGYEKDRARSIWPYRDWVIQAFNDDMPFDEFAVKQMAGDMLPDPTEADRIATGFHRNTMLNEEGGIDAGEFRWKAVVDRVDTTATVFLGLTMACAQCHDHKYDPISQKEYYEFFAFLDGADDVTERVETPDVVEKRERALAEIARLESEIITAAHDADEERAGFASWQEELRGKSVEWKTIDVKSAASENGATLRLQFDGSILATGDIPNDDTYTIECSTSAGTVTGLRLEALPHASLPGNGPGRGVILAEGDFLLTGIEVHAAASPESEFEPVAIAAGDADYAAKDQSATQALDGNSDTGWSIKGEEGRPHHAVFTFAKPQNVPEGGRFRVVLRQDYIHQHTLGRFRLSVTDDTRALSASAAQAEIETIARIDPASRTELQGDALRDYYYLRVDNSNPDSRKRVAELQKSVPPISTTLAFRERSEPRATYIHNRGEYLQPRDRVEPGIPAVLPPLPDGAPRDRVSLARWLVDERNPLTARVTVNRLWQQCFGAGFVTTPEDFGTRGDPPTHPELLDWLAVEFMDQGWSVKEMLRLIVTSATYRQESIVTPRLLERDPENRLLARGPRFRVEGEVMRDSALAAAGLLNPELGGPSVYPPQPAGLADLAYGGPKWPESKGVDRYRRGLYTYWKRTIPYPTLTTFDAPSGDETCVMRRRTNTPLQALALLNDPTFVEASRALAERVLGEAPDSMDDRVDRLFMLCLSRHPDEFELERVKEFVRARQTSDGHDNDEVAIWTLVCRSVLNLDEAITKE